MSIVILRETLSYLRLNLIWPPKSYELNPTNFFYIRFILMAFATCIILIGSLSHLIVSLSNNSNNITEDLVILIAEFGVYYFCSIFVYHQKDIAKIYVDMSDFENFQKPYHFDKSNKKLLFYSRVYKTFIDIAILNIFVSPFLTRKVCEKMNESREFKEICGLLFTTWLPFDVNRFPYKEILYLWQCCTILFTMKGAAVISFAIMESLEHLVIKIQHLKAMIKDAFSSDNNVLRRQNLYKCLEYHIYILDIGKRIDNHYTGCLFLHIALTGALFGCIGYNIMDKFSSNSLSIFMGWLVSLYIVCVSGQRLIDEGMSVADTIYETNWYDNDIHLQKIISLVIMRSQKPIVVHAGPFSYISHVILLTIFKTAYSYLTLLNATSVRK